MKIYMVEADNGWSYEEHRWWNVAAFTSEEAAQEYVQKLPSEIAKGESRIDELDELDYCRGLTADETRERDDLYRKYGRWWHFFDYGYFRIREYELHE